MSLSNLVERIRRAPSPFYGARLDAAGGFDALPPTSRDELLADQLDHPPHGTRRFADAAPPVRAGVSGSGSALLVLTFTAADLNRERAAGARLLSAIGVAAGMRVANALPGALATPGSLLFGDVVEELGGLDVPLGLPDNSAAAAHAWKLFDRVEPEILVLSPATADVLLAAAPPVSRPWWQGIVWQRHLEHGASRPPIPAAAGFTGWQRDWFAVPEASSFVAATCRYETLHLDDHCHAEVMNAGGRSLTKGSGRLLLTPLAVDTPVLRYDTGIHAAIMASDCRCGQKRRLELT